MKTGKNFPWVDAAWIISQQVDDVECSYYNCKEWGIHYSVEYHG